MKRLVLVSVAALSFAACGGGDEVAATATEGDEFCKLAQIAKDDNDALDNVDLGDPAAVKLELGVALDSLTAASAKAPKDIADTVKALLVNEEKLEALLKDNDYDFIKMLATDEGKELSEDATIDQTGEELDEYLSDKCGIATDDTTVDDTLVPDVSAPIGIDLGEGEEAINKFLDFYELGTSTTLTDDERSCIVSALVDEVTGNELNEALTGEASEELQQALGLAFIGCDVAVGG
jgi:hypothetical protein